MHPIDRGAGVALRFLGDQGRVFRDGWGDPGLFGHMDITTATPPATIEVDWAVPHIRDGVALTDGSFWSPVDHLPQLARRARLRLVEPTAGTDKICVLLPAWNDEGYRTRMRLATRLASRGVGSVLLEAAFYGKRRVDYEGCPIRTVSDITLLSRSIVDEARALVVHLAEDERHVGVSGYSMGGSLAGVVATTLEMPIAVTLMAPAHSPQVVFCDGVLRDAVAWDALGIDGRRRLADVLDLGSVLRATPAHATQSAVIVGAQRDGFVPAETTLAIHEHWPGSEMRWVRGGHASLLWTRPGLLTEAILRGFVRSTTRSS